MTPSRRHPRRGFASIMAIILIGLVSAALVALGANFVAEARRTRSEADAAQLRQLLTAGTAAAVAEVRNGEFPHHDLTLPQSLIDRGAALSLASNADKGFVTVHAQLGARRAEQTLHFAREGTRWELASVDLTPATQPSPATTQPSDRSTAASQRS